MDSPREHQHQGKNSLRGCRLNWQFGPEGEGGGQEQEGLKFLRFRRLSGKEGEG